MGRGRAKAKQTKVARALKYSSQDFDVSQLQAELAADSHPESGQDSTDSAAEDPYADDPYAEYADRDAR